MGEIIEKIAMAIGTAVIFTILMTGWSFIWTFPLMWAWNYVMPYLFGFPKVGYWHMFSLYFVLTSLWKIHIANFKD